MKIYIDVIESALDSGIGRSSIRLSFVFALKAVIRIEGQSVVR